MIRKSQRNKGREKEIETGIFPFLFLRLGGDGVRSTKKKTKNQRDRKNIEDFQKKLKKLKEKEIFFCKILDRRLLMCYNSKGK